MGLWLLLNNHYMYTPGMRKLRQSRCQAVTAPTYPSSPERGDGWVGFVKVLRVAMLCARPHLPTRDRRERAGRGYVAWAYEVRTDH